MNEKVGSMNKTPRSLWQLLMLIRVSKRPTQLTCEECFALMEYYADLLAAGAIFDEIRPSVSHHLALCSECQTKFDDWLEKLEEDTES